jgi:hypothetical protein
MTDVIRWRILALDYRDRILAEIDDYQSFWYDLRRNQVGNCQLVLSATSPNLALLSSERVRLAFQLRYPDAAGSPVLREDWGGELVGDGLVLSEVGRPAEQFSFTGADWNFWLTGARVLPPPGQDYLVLDALADVAMKTAVRQSLTDTADPARVFAGLTCQADLSQGAAVKYSARYEVLYDVVTTLAGQGGVKFRVERVGAIGANTFQFRTYAPYLGADRTAGNTAGNAAVVFAAPLGTVTTLGYQRDRSGLVNVAYVGGQGEGAARQIAVYEELTSLGAYRRRETFVDARGATTDAALAAEAVRVFAADAIPAEQVQLALPLTGDTVYGRDWGLGDLVTVRIPELGRTVHAEITAIRVEQHADGLPRIVPTLGSYTTLLDRMAQQARILRILGAR